MQERPTPPTIVFEGLLLIVGGGSVDPDLLRDLYLSGGHLVGADGGADAIVAAGLVPEAIIGDFDLLSNPVAWLGRTRLMKIEEQDTTDFEKALYSTEAPVTVALGVTGERLDHTLAAIDVLARYGRDRTIVLVDDMDVAVTMSGPFTFEVARGERVSIHPLAPVTFRHSRGLKYPLDRVTLAPAQRTGTSNEATDGSFTIQPEAGQVAPWLLILERDNLFRLIASLLAGVL